MLYMYLVALVSMHHTSLPRAPLKGFVIDLPFFISAAPVPSMPSFGGDLLSPLPSGLASSDCSTASTQGSRC